VSVGAELAAALSEFVRGGGVALAVGQLGMRDSSGNYLPYAGPDRLQGLFGVEVDGGMYLKSFTGADESMAAPRCTDMRPAVAGTLGGMPVSGNAGVWVADMRATDAETLLHFIDDEYAFQSAVTEKRHGSGTAIYCGALRLDDALSSKLLDYALGLASMQISNDLPLYVEAVTRGDAVFVINHRDEPVSLTRESKFDLPEAMERLALPPYGACMLRNGYVSMLEAEERT
jgi:hypothetical protein